MILLDPDLDPYHSKQARLPRRSKGSAPAAHSRNHRIPTARTLARFLSEAQSAVKLRGQVTVLLTTDNVVRRLNRRFRGKNKTTDVLSFPAEPLQNAKSPDRVAGDVAISIPTARRQAVAQGHALAAEVKVLILHGLLHLAGYDHETDNGTMARHEVRLRAKLHLPEGLIERSTAGARSIPRLGASSIPPSYRGMGGKAQTTVSGRSRSGDGPRP
jgi:probable rRNA maturation factor